MDERLRFVARLLDGESMNEVCREFGVEGVRNSVFCEPYDNLNERRIVWQEKPGSRRSSWTSCSPARMPKNAWAGVNFAKNWIKHYHTPQTVDAESEAYWAIDRADYNRRLTTGVHHPRIGEVDSAHRKIDGTARQREAE